MKPTLRKILLLLMLLCLSLLLSSCYKEIDPWPVSAPMATQVPPTAVPAQEVYETLIPRTTVTPPAAPAQEPADFWEAEPTEVPGGSVDPGVNG